MAQKNRKKDRQIGKPIEPEKHLINPKHKNTIWTIVIMLVLIIFFIVNNTRDVPEHGPYPPGYNPDTAAQRLQN